MQLIDFFKGGLTISEDQEKEIERSFKTEILPKGSMILQPFNLSQKIVFVEQGLIRNYYIKDDKTITHYFVSENHFTLPIDSIFYQRPSPYGAETLEPTVIRSIRYQEFEQLALNIKGMETFIRQLLIDTILIFSERLYSIQFQTAQERYTTLVEKHPDILRRAPLGHIASYLGITQQTLSVIRSKKL